MKRICLLVLISILLTGCGSLQSGVNTAATAAGTARAALPDTHEVPSFDHVILILLENRNYSAVMGSASQMPHLKELAQSHVLLTNYFAVSHPSLPNYIALVSGSTDNIKSDCTRCFVNQPNLADLLDASGHTWKTYQEDMPSPCYIGDAKPYYQKHNPFIYFDSIRLNAARCDRSIVPLTALDSDLAANQLPNFSLIMPNYCNSGHSCPAPTADNWAFNMVNELQSSSALGKKSLIVVTFDEGAENSDATVGGANGANATSGGGHVATILISPMAKSSFEDSTLYSHYSLLKTILMAWKLPSLGEAGPASTQPILAPWLSGTSWMAPSPSISAILLAHAMASP